MNCWHCKTELICAGQHNLESVVAILPAETSSSWTEEDMDNEDYPVMSGNYSMVTNLTCPKCNSFVEVYLPKDAND